jgi:hypothetical protein
LSSTLVHARLDSHTEKMHGINLSLEVGGSS